MLYICQNQLTLKNIQITEILARNGKVIGLEYQDRDTKESVKRDVTGVFIQIGLVPNSKFLNDIVELNKYGEIIIDARCNTSIEGVFACGDVQDHVYRQAITAAGSGCMSAIDAERYLENSVE